MPRSGTAAGRLRALEHLVVAAVGAATVGAGSVGALVFSIHRSPQLGAIVSVDIAAALALGAVLVNRWRDKAAWARFVASMAPASLGSPGSVKAHAEGLRQKLEADGVAILLAAKGETPVTAAVAGRVPDRLRPGAIVPLTSGAATTGRPARPRGWYRLADSDALRVGLCAYATCALPTVRGRTGQVLVWSSRPTSHSLRRLGSLAHAASDGIEQSRLDDAELRSRLGASHARLHMALLVAAGAAMATAIADWQPALEALTAEVVPQYADYFAVDVVDGGAPPRRVASARGYAVRGAPQQPGALAPEWAAAVEQAATRRQTLAFPMLPRHGPARARAPQRRVDPRLERLHAGLGLASWVLIPIELHGGSIAVFSVGTAEPRRGLRPSDVAVFEEVATRCAMAHERVALYQEAASREQRLQTLIDASPLAIIQLTAKGELRTWNRAALELFASGPDADVPGVDRSAWETFLALRQRLVAGERGVVDRATLGRSNGDPPVRVSVAASLVPGSDSPGDDDLLCMVSDITQQEAMEQALHAKERMEALGRLAGGVAHDFNNLLTVIVGYSEVLADALGPAHELYTDVNAIREAGERAAAFTEQLLTISRGRVVEAKALDLGQTVRSLEPVLRRLVREDVTFAVDSGGDAGWVRIDKSQFEQVILNLVVNARDAMPNGGSLKLTVEQTTGEDGACWSLVTVADTGVGMDGETLKRCFEPFFTTKGLAEGTGLGLATVYSIVDQAGGAISVETAPGCGTSFRVMFPTVSALAAAPRSRTSTWRGTVGLGRATVLLVEDDDMVRTFAHGVLSGAGYGVLEACDGAGALELARAADLPSALVADVVMPGMSGPDVAAQLPGVPVLYISGYIEDERWRSLLQPTPVSRFLAKPFTRDELLDALRELLATHQGSNR